MDIIQKLDFCTKVRPLASVAEIRTGYSFRQKLREEQRGDLAVIQMKDLDDSNLLHPESLVRIQMPELAERHFVTVGDLLFRSRGRSHVTSIVAADFGRAVLAAPLMIIRPQAELVEPLYLQWFINHPETQEVMTNRAAGSAVKMIAKAELERLPIALPPIDVQRRIAEIGQLAAEEAKLSEELVRNRRRVVERTLMSIVEAGLEPDWKNTARNKKG